MGKVMEKRLVFRAASAPDMVRPWPCWPSSIDARPNLAVAGVSVRPYVVDVVGLDLADACLSDCACPCVNAVGLLSPSLGVDDDNDVPVRLTSIALDSLAGGVVVLFCDCEFLSIVSTPLIGENIGVYLSGHVVPHLLPGMDIML